MSSRLRIFAFLCCGLAAGALCAGTPRAASWKPERVPGSARLALAELRHIVLPDSEAEAALSQAIDDFSRLFAERYGRDLAVLESGAPKRTLKLEITGGPAEGGAFTLIVERTRVTLRAADAAGCANGLYALMMDQMGARWYWPGELGFEWVTPKEKWLPARRQIERPAFVQRSIHGIKGDYRHHNRLNHRYSLNHNLSEIFTAEVYAEQPEIFGERYGRPAPPPKGNHTTDPQPDLTHPDAVRLAAEAALTHFRDNPESTSFSLSANDNTSFDTSLRTRHAVSPLRYFRGRPNYTDFIFDFTNQVAELVFDQGAAWETPKGEKRYLTQLAYFWAEAAPTIPIHPRVIPTLTSDRAQWHDPAYRKEDKALIQAWAQSGAERLATWDYYFGAPYLYPRQLNHWIAESLPFIADAGIDVFFTQLSPFWGLDGGKAWLVTQLLWDPYQDADALLGEYYSHFFGAAAAEMRAFYTFAEDWRNAHEGPANWIKLYFDEAGIEMFAPEALEHMRSRLERAKALVRDDRRRAARVAVVDEAFALTEAYARFQGARRQLIERCLEAAPTEVIEAQLASFKERRETFYTKKTRLLEDSEYAPARRTINYDQSDPEALARAAIEGSGKDRFESLYRNSRLGHRGWTELTFHGPRFFLIEGLLYSHRPSQHYRQSPSAWSDGRSGLRIEGAEKSLIAFSFTDLSEGTYELRLRAAWQVSLGNRVHIRANWKQGPRSLDSKPILRIPTGSQAEPTDLHLRMEAPENADSLNVQILYNRQGPEDFFDLSYFDFGRIGGG